MSGGGEITEGNLITTANTFAEAETAITETTKDNNETMGTESGTR